MAKSKTSMSNEAVVKATGKTWAAWFKILDRCPKDKTHTERAAWLYKNHLTKGWWCQMVTVTYEQTHGLRKKYQTVSGFQVSASKTVPVSVSKLYAWWTTKRHTWLERKDLTITSQTKNKYLHGRLPDGTRIDVGFLDHGKNKSAVAVQHTKLKSAVAVKNAKAWWSDQLEMLSEHILRSK